MEILIITHHPSIGIAWNTLSLAQTPHSQTLTVTFIFLSCSSPWSLARSSPLHELKSRGIHREESGGHPATSAGGQCWQPGLKSTQYVVLRIYIWQIYRHFLPKGCRNWRLSSRPCSSAYADVLHVFPGYLIMFYSTGGEKCSRGPFRPLSKQAATTHNQSYYQRPFPTSTCPGHQWGVCHHANTWRTAVWQQCYPEVTISLLPHCRLLKSQEIIDFILALHLPCAFCLYACCSAQKESTNKANMKRENKAYSYKEQIIEMELQEVKSFTLLVCGKYVWNLFHRILPDSVGAEEEKGR